MGRVLGVLALVAFALLGAREPSAKLRPYYVVDGLSFGQLKPRVLFILDTSGSMAYRSDNTDTLCRFNQCEGDESVGSLRSRIRVARDAVNTVVNSAKDNAKFSLMTFDVLGPPSSTPGGDCGSSVTGISTSCTGSTVTNNFGDGNVGSAAWNACIADGRYACATQTYGCGWSTCTRVVGTSRQCVQFNRFEGFGTTFTSSGAAEYFTRLCSNEKRPYPYLRWDNLGPTSTVVTNGMATLPASPMVPRTSANVNSAAVATRKVQWFPQFNGVRFRATASHTTGSVGDYSAAQVTGNDFYYWPYVDGFPWYGAAYYFSGSGAGFYFFQNPGLGNAPSYNQLGVGESTSPDGAALYSPFYLADELASTGVPTTVWGPASETESDDRILGVTGRAVEGGVDAEGGTPWASAIGAIPATPPQDNRPFAHTTAASYLKFVTSVTSQGTCTPTSAVLITDGQPSSGEGGATLYNRLAALRNTLGVDVYVVGFFTGTITQTYTESRTYGTLAACQAESTGCAAENYNCNPYSCNCGFFGCNTCYQTCTRYRGTYSYSVTVATGEIAQMACAGAGGTGASPCTSTPADNWDTCRDPANPATNCAFQANSPQELEDALIEIINKAIEFDVSSGPGSAVNDFGASAGGSDPLQTALSAQTDWPSWAGHVRRELCGTQIEDPPGSGNFVLAPFCQEQSPAFTGSDVEPTFGACTQGRAWDAGECLVGTPWYERRLYSDDGNRNRIPILSNNTPAAGASTQFYNLLNGKGLLVGATLADRQAHANRVAQFVAGKDWPDNWKLPGLANSAPIVVRRVPEINRDFAPTVPIRDPHCAGRLFDSTQEIPSTLEKFAEQSNATSGARYLASPAPHFEYQEAVVVGDDLGFIHAFQYNSGNELWAYMPSFLAANAVSQEAIGAARRGQPDEIDQHKYGVASTLNAGWVYDPSVGAPAAGQPERRWRHVGIIGTGAGGTEYVALDLSHMSPASPLGPFEILWTSEDTALKASWDLYNGETWSRPALIYEGITEGALIDSAVEPRSYVVTGSGYRAAGEPAGSRKGRSLVKADALTGVIQTAHDVSLPAAANMYDSTYGMVSDLAVVSHCESKYWAEAQEAYIADPAGRLYRWDLGGNDDSGTTWPLNGAATAAYTFPACEWNGSSCNVVAGKGDVFTFPAAVTTSNRLDDYENPAPAGDVSTTTDDRVLIALASGAPTDDAIDGGDPANKFVSSLYILTDNHSTSANGGFAIPGGAPAMTVSQVGDYPGYLRLPLTNITRTRVVTPYPGAAPIAETRAFGKGARPIRAPRISVRGVVLSSGTPSEVVRTDVEVFDVTFTVYEPGVNTCDTRWRDPSTGEWYFDEGSTYEITFRLAALDDGGFDLANPVALPAGLSGLNGFSNNGLQLVSVDQRQDGGCADGNCGPSPGAPKPISCDQGADAGAPGVSSLQTIGYRELDGFTPLE
jgi:hypothetical protein